MAGGLKIRDMNLDLLADTNPLTGLVRAFESQHRSSILAQAKNLHTQGVSSV